MVIGATVFAALILLLLLAERGSSMLWHGTDQPLFYCRTCDLRYPRHELGDRRLLVCPKGHLTSAVATGISFSTIFICACCVFIAVAVVLIASGRVS